MDAVLRAFGLYLVLLLIFRISGKRTLAQITTFDFVLLLIVGEATQQGLLGDDFSVTNAIVVVTTLITVDVLMSVLKDKVPSFGKATESVPLVIVRDGEPIEDRMKRARIDLADVLSAGRASQGIESIDQIKYAVLERGGSISVVPYRDGS